MRIDDENKVVWCNDVILDWYKSYSIIGNQKERKKRIIYHLARVGFGYGLTNVNDKELLLDEWREIKKICLIQAVLNDYKFKLEQPKKYYWRKKKEHLTSFEKTNQIYLNFNNSHKKIFLEDIQETSRVNTKFTEQEAHDLLKNDFDMFERVEVD